MKKNVAERQIQLLMCWVTQHGVEGQFDEVRNDFAIKHPDIQVLVVDLNDMAPSVARFEDTCFKMACLHCAGKVCIVVC
jgi:hypothetical protein